MSEVIEKLDPSVKRVNQPVTYILGWLLIISSIAYWTNNQDPSSPTITNKFGLTIEWLLLAHLILTLLGLFLLLVSRYSEVIGKNLTLRFYNFVIFAREKKITNLSLLGSDPSQDPIDSIYNFVRIFLIGLLALIGLELLFSFMSKITVVSSINIILLVIALPLLLIWINLKKLASNDYMKLESQAKSKVCQCPNKPGAVKVGKNQIAYVELTNKSNKFYKLIRANQIEIVSGTDCTIFAESFFTIKRDAIRLHTDLKSDGGEITMSVKIIPKFDFFPNFASEESYAFISSFISEIFEDKLYAMIPHGLIEKANNAKNISLKKLNELILERGKSETEVNTITDNLFSKETYIEISTEIKSVLIKRFNELLNAENAFDITIELDDKLDRKSFAKEVKNKVEAYLKKEEQRIIDEKKVKAEFDRKMQEKLMDLTGKVIEKQGLDHEEQKVVVGTSMDIVTNINLGFNEIAQKHHTPDKLELYARELIDAHDFLLDHDTYSNESKIQYLQEKSFFADYPQVSPIHLYSKIVEMDRNQREEKIKQALNELINSNRLTNG